MVFLVLNINYFPFTGQPLHGITCVSWFLGLLSRCTNRCGSSEKRAGVCYLTRMIVSALTQTQQSQCQTFPLHGPLLSCLKPTVTGPFLLWKENNADIRSRPAAEIFASNPDGVQAERWAVGVTATYGRRDGQRFPPIAAALAVQVTFLTGSPGVFRLVVHLIGSSWKLLPSVASLRVVSSTRSAFLHTHNLCCFVFFKY